MSEIEVLQVQSELDRMMGLFRERKPKRVLEIGCWDGGTLREWLRGVPKGGVVAAVDMKHRNRSAYDEWVRPGTELHTFTGASQSAEAVAFMRDHGPYDWVFVDGDHGDWGVQTDVANVRPLVREGGLLLLHDVTPPEGTETYPPGDVLRGLASEGLETWEYADLEPAPWARGIGVVQL